MRWRFDNWRRQFLPGVICAIALILLSGLGILQPLEHLAYQALFMLRGEQVWDQRVVVVNIDDRSLAKFGRFPWNRSRYVELLEVFTQAEASVVAFDLIWSEPSAEDAQLAQAIAQHGNVVLARAWDNLRLPLVPVKALSDVATDMGHIQKQVDADGQSRHIPASLENIPAFAIATLQAYSLSHDSIALPDPNSAVWVNWLRSQKYIPNYSFLDVVQNRIPIQVFQDKIVLVGITATGFDELVTPFNRTPPTSGVYLHATVINNLLQQNQLQIVPPGWILLLLSFVGLGFSRSLERYRTSSQVWIGVSLAIAWGVYCWSALKFGAIWLPVVAPILLVLSVVSFVILQERLSLNAILQRQVKELWDTYYNDLVMRRVEQSRLVTHQLGQQPISMQRVTQLATLAEQFGRSHAAQAAIARNLSIGLLASDLDGFIWFCNPNASSWLNVDIGTLLPSKLVPHWINAHQWQMISQSLTQVDLAPIEVTQSDRWFELRFEPLFYQSQDADPSGLLLILEDITDRKQAAIALQTYANTQADLNQRLTERTTQLELVNQELEAFSYAVSHDLRAPLRRIKGFSQLLLEDYTTALDEDGKTYLHRIDASVQRMGQLIEDLLKLSRIIRAEMYFEPVDLSGMATSIAQDLQQTQRDRCAKFTIQPDLRVKADERLLRIALENLLGNAWKYTSQRTVTEIELGQLSAVEVPTFFIRDNGAGFDMTQANRLFGAFQRLHTDQEFPGTGIGLMTTRRIIHRHQGRIWAEAIVDRGATFYFTLPF